ncbi:hypothetical protein M885DRAFT_21395 [Pelagophyceae sp. CCMP2097]|nr:hypothetical protein M885DRAFT_21395 [Pelagophyceae sp. CCMP2097]
MRARVWLLVWRRKAKQRLDRRDRLDSVVMSFAKWRAYPAPDEASPKARWYDKYLRGFAAFAAPPAFAVSSLAITAPEAARPSALAAFGRKRCLPSAAASAAKKRTCDRALRYAPDLAAVVAPLRRAARRHLSALRAGATLVVAPVVPWKVVVVAGEGALLRWLQDALAGEDDREVSDAGKRGFLVAPTLVNAAVRVCVVRADEGDAALRGAAGVVIVVEPGAAALPTALLARCAAQGLLPLLVVHAGSDVPLAAGAGFKVACDLRVPAAALRGDAAAAVAALRALQVALTWLAAHAPPPPLIVLQTPLDFFAAAGGDVSAAIHAAAVHRMPDVYPPELVGTARSALRLLPHRTFTADEDGLPIDYADEKRSHNVADCIRAAAGDEDHMRQSLLRCFRLLEPLHFDAPTQPRVSRLFFTPFFDTHPIFTRFTLGGRACGRSRACPHRTRRRGPRRRSGSGARRSRSCKSSSAADAPPTAPLKTPACAPSTSAKTDGGASTHGFHRRTAER